MLPGGYITQQACTTMSLQRRHLARHADEKTMHAFLCLCIPLVVLLVGWHQVGALPDCDCSGISHQGPSAGCNAAYPPTRRGGCNATEEYTSACPAAVWGLVAGAIVISASDGEGRLWRWYFCRSGLTQCQITYNVPTKKPNKRPKST